MGPIKRTGTTTSNDWLHKISGKRKAQFKKTTTTSKIHHADFRKLSTCDVKNTLPSIEYHCPSKQKKTALKEATKVYEQLDNLFKI
ncbi:MAG: hypothetical protein QS721_02710 [Candidatus Endonucleobacter sp. (ex Gigantidas childressi)]|nr:hypothetical protein [Candidatus Endonucleobacter sp. (ex Gigantidas childressi)]